MEVLKSGKGMMDNRKKIYAKKIIHFLNSNLTLSDLLS